MKQVEFVVPALRHEIQAVAYIQEFIDAESEVHGSGGLDRYRVYQEWLDKLEVDRTLVSTEGHRVRADTYFLMDKEEACLIGMINIRHRLNEYLLREGGHIGYSVRPSQRRQGYASKMLALGVARCCELQIARVLIVCSKNNPASAHTIQKNHGELENEVELADGDVIQRYWISV